MNALPVDCLGLIGLLERLATEKYDGHLTILRFTCGWKVMLGTPMLGDMGNVEIGDLDSHATLTDAIHARLAAPNEYATYEDLKKRVDAEDERRWRESDMRAGA